MNLLYINLTILEKNYFQKIIEKSGIDLPFAILFNVWINRKQQDSHSCLCIQSVVIYCFGWSIWKNLTSHIQVVGKEGVFNLTAFREYGHCSLIIHQSWTSDNSIKITCNVKSVMLSNYDIKFVDLFYTLNIFFIHPWFCNDALVIWKYWFTGLSGSSKYWHISFYNIKISYLLMPSLISLNKSLSS